MSKRVRTLLIALVALVIVGGGLAALLLLPEKESDTPTPDTETVETEPTEAPAIVITDKRTNKNGGTVAKPVVSLEIVNREGEFRVTTDDAGTMAVETFRDLPADSAAIETLCANAAYLTALSTPEMKEDEAAYGLTDPTATVFVEYHDGTSTLITFGAQSKGSDGYYCRVDGDDTLYIVDSATACGYMTRDVALIGKNLIAPPSPKEGDDEGQGALFRLWLTGSLREQPIEIVTDEDASFPSLTYTSTMYMKAPYLRSLDSDLFSSMSGVMAYLQAADVEAAHPTAEQLEEYGLADPHSVAAFTLAVTASRSGDNGGTITTHYDDREHMVMLGNTDEDGRYYALVDGLDIVYLLDPTSVPWAEKTFTDLVSKLVFLKDITTVKTLSVTDEGVTTDFTLTHHPEKEKRAEQLVIKADGKTYDTSDFRTVYASMMSVHRVGEKEDEVDTTKPPATEWTLTFNDGSEPLHVQLYEMTGSRYLLVMQDGEQTAASISDVETFQKQYRSFLAGEKVVSPY